VEAAARRRHQNWRNRQRHRSFVNRLLRLTSSPDIIEAILRGRQPKGMQLEEVTDAISSEWDEQRKPLWSGLPKARGGRALIAIRRQGAGSNVCPLCGR
jgi:hypothetical protein